MAAAATSLDFDQKPASKQSAGSESAAPPNGGNGNGAAGQHSTGDGGNGGGAAIDLTLPVTGDSNPPPASRLPNTPNANGTTALAVARPDIDPLLGVFGALVDPNVWNRLVKMTDIFAQSKLVPKHFQGNRADCFIALQMAVRLQCDAFMLMQNLYIVHGKPGLEAKFAIAMLNTSGKIKGKVRYELSGTGMQRQCIASATDAKSGETVSSTVTMQIAKNEGWIDKDGSKWKTIPDLMLQYRAAMWMIRTNYPEVIMGMQSADEIEDVGVIEVQGTVRSRAAITNSLDELQRDLAPKGPVQADSQVEQPAEREPGQEG